MPTAPALAAYYERVRQRLAAIKLERGCEHCGYRAHADGLQLDHRIPIHVSGQKRLSRTSLAWLAQVETDLNIAVLCGSCHAIKTAAEWRVKREAPLAQ